VKGRLRLPRFKYPRRFRSACLVGASSSGVPDLELDLIDATHHLPRLCPAHPEDFLAADLPDLPDTLMFNDAVAVAGSAKVLACMSRRRSAPDRVAGHPGGRRSTRSARRGEGPASTTLGPGVRG
jgi:hypothetical protein